MGVQESPARANIGQEVVEALGGGVSSLLQTLPVDECCLIHASAMGTSGEHDGIVSSDLARKILDAVRDEVADHWRRAGCRDGLDLLRGAVHTSRPISARGQQRAQTPPDTAGGQSGTRASDVAL